MKAGGIRNAASEISSFLSCYDYIQLKLDPTGPYRSFIAKPGWKRTHDV
jgi:hypothetical protein